MIIVLYAKCFFFYANKEKIYFTYVSKHNSDCGKQVTLFMISKEKTMALSCSKRTISIIKWSNFQTLWWFVLSDLTSFVTEKTRIAWKCMLK